MKEQNQIQGEKLTKIYKKDALVYNIRAPKKQKKVVIKYIPNHENPRQQACQHKYYLLCRCHQTCHIFKDQFDIKL